MLRPSLDGRLALMVLFTAHVGAPAAARPPCGRAPRGARGRARPTPRRWAPRKVPPCSQPSRILPLPSAPRRRRPPRLGRERGRAQAAARIRALRRRGAAPATRCGARDEDSFFGRGDPPAVRGAEETAQGGRPNLILLTDSYKLSHHRQYPPRTHFVTAYFESRAGARFPETVLCLLRRLEMPIVQADIDEAEEVCRLHVGPGVFNRAGWQHILDAHGGRLPLSIRAVSEGIPVPTGNALMTVVNTDPACCWLPNYMETLLTHVWYPSTVATQSHQMKKTILKCLAETGASVDSIDHRLHDFGFRGASSVETAGIGAAAHLLSFRGTDTLAGIVTLRDHYGAPMAGVSVPAAEHSTITAWTRTEKLAAYRNMLRQYPEGPVAIVADSYDLDHACQELFGVQMRDEILSRSGVTIVRPDSGEPAATVLRVHEMLGERFGTARNAKGFRELCPKLGILQGDGIDVDSIEGILATLRDHGWSTGALTLGSGGASYPIGP